MKKRISVLLALMMLLGILSGCGGTTQSEETDPNEGDDGTIKIGLSMFTQEFPFYVSMQEAFEEACAENGYELISTNASMDISKQIDGCMDMLFAAGEGSRQLRNPLLQTGEYLKEALHLLLNLLGIVLSQESAHLDIFHNRQLGKHMPGLQNLGNAPLGHRMGGKPVNALSLKEDGAAAGLQDPGNTTEQRRLSGSVCANQRYYLTLIHAQADAFQRTNGTVFVLKLFHFQQILHVRHPPSPDMPR